LISLAAALVLLLNPPAWLALFLGSSALLPFFTAVALLKRPILLGLLAALSGRRFAFALNLTGHLATGRFSCSWCCPTLVAPAALSAFACTALGLRLVWCGSSRLVGKPVRSLRLGSR
jgi:hypothetical protein